MLIQWLIQWLERRRRRRVDAQSWVNAGLRREIVALNREIGADGDYIIKLERMARSDDATIASLRTRVEKQDRELNRIIAMETAHAAHAARKMAAVARQAVFGSGEGLGR